MDSWLLCNARVLVQTMVATAFMYFLQTAMIQSSLIPVGPEIRCSQPLRTIWLQSALGTMFALPVSPKWVFSLVLNETMECGPLVNNLLNSSHQGTFVICSKGSYSPIPRYCSFRNHLLIFRIVLVWVSCCSRHTLFNLAIHPCQVKTLHIILKWVLPWWCKWCHLNRFPLDARHLEGTFISWNFWPYYQ